MLFAATATAEARPTPPRASVNVPADPAVFATTMLETTVVVDDGTVYSVVAVFVVAAVLASAFVTVGIYFSFVAISYYLLQSIL
jgi:hypothetical protein